MNLEEKGFRFCISPNLKEAKWINPVLLAAFYPGWIDATEMNDEQLLELVDGPRQAELFAA